MRQKAAGSIRDTRTASEEDWCIRVTTKADIVPHDSLYFSFFFLPPPFFLSLASTPVIRQLAKEIRIHNWNRFSCFSVPSRPVRHPSFLRRHVRVSKLLSLRVHKVDWAARARAPLARSLGVVRAAAPRSVDPKVRNTNAPGICEGCASLRVVRDRMDSTIIITR